MPIFIALHITWDSLYRRRKIFSFLTNTQNAEHCIPSIIHSLTCFTSSTLSQWPYSYLIDSSTETVFSARDRHIPLWNCRHHIRGSGSDWTESTSSGSAKAVGHAAWARSKSLANCVQYPFLCLFLVSCGLIVSIRYKPHKYMYWIQCKFMLNTCPLCGFILLA